MRRNWGFDGKPNKRFSVGYPQGFAVGTPLLGMALMNYSQLFSGLGTHFLWTGRSVGGNSEYMVWLNQFGIRIG